MAGFLLLVTTFVAGPLASSEARFIGLDEIERGMAGTWKTVVTGTEISTFELRVVGVARNFVGPRQSVIICEAIDASNVLSGPVGGMSGSPVFIDGRLAGAYAYGYLWPKEQAVIGVTPIEEMMPVLDTPAKSRDELSARPRGAPSGLWTRAFFDGPHKHDEPRGLWPGPASQGGGSSADPDRRPAALAAGMAPLPTPLQAGGFSLHTIERFAPLFARLGLDLVQGTAGGAAPANTEFELVPGAPVAGVLASGDFSMAGTGTVTYREGDRLLAFGHPFFQFGPLEMPMAGAEILTVVRSVPRSFKLSNTGPVVGTVYHDRLTAIAGEVGREADTIPLLVRKQGPDGTVAEFSADLWNHDTFAPLVGGMALVETLVGSLEAGEEQTVRLKGLADLAAHGSVEWADVATGPDGIWDLAVDFMIDFGRLMENPFESVDVARLEFSFEVVPGWRESGLRAVRLTDERILRGEAVEMVLEFYNYRDEIDQRRVRIPLPADARSGDRFTVLVADSREAERRAGTLDNYVGSVGDFAEQWRRNRSRAGVYVQLLRKGDGLRLPASDLHDLPPSVAEPFRSPANNIARKPLDEVVVREVDLTLDGVFRGSFSLDVVVE